MKTEDIAAWGPRDYVQIPLMVDSWKVLDIGPGAYPLKRANVYLDKYVEILEAIDLADGQTVMEGDLEEGLSAIPDNAFDYVWCSHVLEHVLEVQKAANTLSRIARRGTIVMPSFAKESLFHFEEREHKWLVLPNPTAGLPPIFVEQNHGFVEKLRDQLVQKATCFLYRTGTQHDCTAERHMRFWYQEHEPDLDIVYHWSNELKLQVVR